MTTNEQLSEALASADWVVTSQEHVIASLLLASGSTVCRLSLTPYPGGDAASIICGRRVGVEVKGAQDLIASWVGPRMKCKASCDWCHGAGCMRLRNQLERMLAHYDDVILQVHGWFGVDPKGYLVTDSRRNAVVWDGLANTLDYWSERGVKLALPAVDLAHVAHRLVSLKRYRERRAK